jgi:hypothetical protein|tara:strand:+ start:394 stop:660 length:267 start_codon:yes stop_codon:yes gene_type:complete
MDNTQENQNPEEVNPTGELNGQQALNVLIQAVRIAQGKGAYTIEDAEIISKAIKIFVPPTPAGEEGATTDPIVNEEVAAEPVMTKVTE